jgi:DNA-binding transcriptional regulator YdaS (Cro superfamily)
MGGILQGRLVGFTTRDTCIPKELLVSLALMDTALVKAISAAGGQSALAKALNVTPQAVQQWKRVPPERVLDVERITGISRYELRSDVFGAPPKRGKVAA